VFKVVIQSLKKDTKWEPLLLKTLFSQINYFNPTAYRIKCFHLFGGYKGVCSFFCQQIYSREDHLEEILSMLLEAFTLRDRPEEQDRVLCSAIFRQKPAPRLLKMLGDNGYKLLDANDKFVQYVQTCGQFDTDVASEIFK
jgi:hypothetical protein